jgi:hypothetical protein
MESIKSQTPSTKPGPRPQGGDSEGEITNKSQIPILNDQNRFGPPEADQVSGVGFQVSGRMEVSVLSVQVSASMFLFPDT